MTRWLIVLVTVCSVLAAAALLDAGESAQDAKQPQQAATKPAEQKNGRAADSGANKPAEPTTKDDSEVDPLADDALSDELLEKLEKEANEGEAVSEAEEDPPLIRIGDRMRAVQKRLAQADTGQETIQLQEAIIKDLDELLKKMQSGQACPQCGKSNCQQHVQQRQRAAAQAQQQRQQQASSQIGNQPARDARRTMPRGPDARSKAELERMAKAIWGHLPPKMREQMEQAFSATLLPQYELLIERYFRTLAEQGAGNR